MTKYNLSFSADLNPEAAAKLRNRIAQILERMDFDSLTLLFSSVGGSTAESLYLYNFIRALPQPIHMHGVGHIGSSAVPVFLAGHKRTCTPFSRFFFHAYDWGFSGRQLSDRIAEALQLLHSDIELSRDIAARHTSIPPDRLDELYRTAPTPTIITPDEAVKLGIIEEITELNPTGAIQADTVIWTCG